jgi:hypothetical protein
MEPYSLQTCGPTEQESLTPKDLELLRAFSAKWVRTYPGTIREDLGDFLGYAVLRCLEQGKRDMTPSQARNVCVDVARWVYHYHMREPKKKSKTKYDKRRYGNFERISPDFEGHRERTGNVDFDGLIAAACTELDPERNPEED